MQEVSALHINLYIWYVSTLPFRFIELEIIMHCSGRAEIANWLCAPGANSTLHMTINIKNYVIQELEAYPRILRQISVLRYEMEHPAHVSAQEMLDAMTYACGDRTGSSPGHVSDKTFYIAMNYRQKAAAANSEISEEISAKLLELERKKGRIEYYVGMLDSRKANVIRLCFFDGRTIEDAAEELNISAKTAQIAKKKAIEDLTDLFALTSNIN